MASTPRTVLAACALLMALCPPVRAIPLGFNFEVDLPTGENPFARHIWGAADCAECTPEQFEAMVPPPGYVKGAFRVFLMAEGGGVLPTPPEGLPRQLDLIPEVPGPEFTYTAHVLGGEVLGIAPGAVPLAIIDVRRHTFFRYEAGQVVHEVTDPDGDVYVAINLDLDLAATIDYEQVGALSELPVPEGWTYSSRVLAEDLLLATDGLARVFVQGTLAAWQRVGPRAPVAGTRLLVTDRPKAKRNKLKFVSKDATIAVAAEGEPGDPRCEAGEGGTLLVASRTSDRHYIQGLPCERWSATGPAATPKKLRYRDPKREDGPCSKILLRDGKLTAKCKGRRDDPFSYDLVSGQSEEPMVVLLSVGETQYCAEFGGTVQDDGADGKRFAAKNAAVVPGCALGGEPGCLLDESDVPVLETPDGMRYVRTPDERFEDLDGYSYAPNYVTLDGLRMHYVDEGPADGEVVLMLHGQPSWSYLYRKMIPILVGAGFRVIATDHIGMGRSDKPVDVGVHTYEQHVDWTYRFIEALGLEDVTLFCQDWGGLIGLRVAGDHPDRFARIVVANSTLPIIPPGLNPFTVPDPVEIDCSRGDFGPDIFVGGFPVGFQGWIEYCLEAPNLRPSQVVEGLTLSELAPEEEAAYNAPFPGLIYKAAIRAFPSMIAAVEDQNQPAWDALGLFDKPFLTLMGEFDPNLGSQENQDRLVNHVPGAAGQPHARLEAAHFIQEDVGEDLASRVVSFMEASPLDPCQEAVVRDPGTLFPPENPLSNLTRFEIRALTPSGCAALHEPLVAFNWYSLADPESYLRYAAEVGGILTDRGHRVLLASDRVETFEAPAGAPAEGGAYEHEILSLAWYRNAGSFLDMVLSPEFQAISGDQQLGARQEDYVWGLQRCIVGCDTVMPPHTGQFVAHVFRYDGADMETALLALASTPGAPEMIYAGELVADFRVLLGNQDLNTQTPPWGQGAVVYQVASRDAALAWLSDPAFTTFRQDTADDVLVLLEDAFF